jgi:hypothetical protein
MSERVMTERTFAEGAGVHWHGHAEFGETPGPHSGTVERAVRGVDGTYYAISQRMAVGTVRRWLVHWSRLA